MWLLTIWTFFVYFAFFILIMASFAGLVWSFVAVVETLTRSMTMTRPVSPGPPFCRDCRWCLPRRSVAGLRRDLSGAVCMHASAAHDPGEVLVTGVLSEDNAYSCSTMRGLLSRCGPEGQHWAGWSTAARDIEPPPSPVENLLIDQE